jgi:UDPglucose--hexose-1-phosphate uridylyltransferase
MVRRLRAHARDKKIKATIVFKNEWADAGASLEHTHTQLVGMPTVPASLKKEEKLCKSACPFCLLAIDDHYSKIISSGHFLLLAPFAPRFNHETWIVPKSHTANLTDLDEKALAELAHVLGVALRTQDATLGYPPYNLLFHLSPHSQKNFHFRIEICPRLAKWAGFEHAAEVVMNSVKPEWTASEYKSKLQA